MEPTLTVKTRPTGTLIGTWSRSTVRIRRRLRLWLLGVVVSPVCCLIGPLTVDSNGDVALLGRYIAFGGLFVLLMGLMLLVNEWLMLRDNPEGCIEVYDDGLVIRKADGTEFAAYQWDGIIRAKWPTENGMEKIVLDIHEQPSTFQQMAHVITNSGNPVSRAVLRLTTQDGKVLVFNGTVERLDELLPTLWKILADYWARRIISLLETGMQYPFGTLWLTPQGVQKKTILVPWSNVGFDLHYPTQKVFLFALDARRKRHSFKEKVGVKGTGVGQVVRHFYLEAKKQQNESSPH